MAYTIHAVRADGTEGEQITSGQTRAQIIRAVYMNRLGPWNCEVPTLPRFGRCVMVVGAVWPSYIIKHI